MSKEPARPMANDIQTWIESAPLDLIRAKAILANAKCWIGWEAFDEGGEDIVVDGYMTPEELGALLIVMRHRET